MAYLDIYSYSTLIEKLGQTYGEKNIILKYYDDEDEEIVISSQAELENAIEISNFTNNQLKLIVKNSTDKLIIDYLSIDINRHKMQNGTLETPPQTAVQQQQPQPPPTASRMPQYRRESNYLISNATELVRNELLNQNQNLNTSSISSASFDAESSTPPVWFTSALNKFKNEILSEIDARIMKIVAASHFDDNKNALEICDLLEQLNFSFKFNNLERVKDIQHKLNSLNAFKATFVRDCNVPDGTKFEAHTKFNKSWLLKNTGNLAWAENSIELVNISGNIVCKRRNVYLSRSVKTDEIVEVEVEFEAPSEPGKYFSQWVLMCQNYSFGPRIWCEIEVIQTTVNLLENDNIPSKIQEAELNDHEVTRIQPVQQQPQPTFQTSTPRLDDLNSDETLSNLMDEFNLDSQDDNEFVIIPECLDLSKPWKPSELIKLRKQSIVTILSDDSPSVSGRQSTTSHQQLQNLMSFSTSAMQNSSSSSYANENETLIKMTDSITTTTSEKQQPMNMSIAESLIKFKNDRDDNDDLLTSNHTATPVTLPNINNISTIGFEGLINSTVDLITLSTTTDIKNESTATTSNSIQAAQATATNLIGDEARPSLQSLQQTNFLLQCLNESNENDSPLDKLIYMGFANRALNKKLLDKYNNDVEKVIEDLLKRSDNDWASFRH